MEIQFYQHRKMIYQVSGRRRKRSEPTAAAAARVQRRTVYYAFLRSITHYDRLFQTDILRTGRGVLARKLIVFVKRSINICAYDPSGPAAMTAYRNKWLKINRLFSTPARAPRRVGGLFP